MDRRSTSRDHHVRAKKAPVTPVGACRKLHIEQSLQKIEIPFSVTCEDQRDRQINLELNLSWDMPGAIRPIWVADKNPVLEIPASTQKNDTEQTIPLLPWFEDVLLEVEQEQRTGWVFSPASLQLKLGRGARQSRPKADWVARIAE